MQAGVEGSSDEIGVDIGAGAVVAIYANVLEYVTLFSYNTTDCLVQAEANFNLNVGAYARLSMVIGPTVVGPTPTVSTTLLAGPTLTQCLYSGGGDSFTSSTVTLSSTSAENTCTESGGPTYKRAAAVAVTPAPRAAAAENSVYTLHRCNAAAVNCPEGAGEDVVVTRTAPAHVLAPTRAVNKRTFNEATGAFTLSALPTPVVGKLAAAY